MVGGQPLATNNPSPGTASAAHFFTVHRSKITIQMTWIKFAMLAATIAALIIVLLTDHKTLKNL